MKRSFVFALVLCLMLTLTPFASAASDEASEAANALYELGLFQGTAENADGTPVFDLDRAPTRAEAVTMLVRLLGGEDAALAGDWDTPFTDVPEWAEPYVGYAYSKGLTDGTGETAFGSDASVTAAQYITFVLRALGYESGADFEWDKAWELSDEIGLTGGEYGASTASFLRGDVAVISYNALSCTLKDSDVTLLDTLTGELAAYEIEGAGTVYMPEDCVVEGGFVTSPLPAVQVSIENGILGLHIGVYRQDAYDAAGQTMPEDVVEYSNREGVRSGIPDGVEFSYDEYGNYCAVYTSPDGYDAYQALIVTDDFAASLMFTVPEGEMDNYDAGYILSLVELA